MPDEIASVEIRPAAASDAAAIAAVRRASWFAAYDGLIDHELIDRATAPIPAWTPPPYRRTIVAVASANGQPAQVSAGPVADGLQVVVGFASFGPERTVDSATPPPQPLPPGPAKPQAGAATASSRLSRTRSRQPVPAGPLTPAGQAGQTGEVYAIYLAPAAWSTGTGRALMAEALAALRAGGYQHVVLWVLTGNARARRFYAKAGFAPDGATNTLTSLGGVEELRYARPLAP